VGYERPVARELAWWFANSRARLPERRLSRYLRNAGLVAYLGGGEPAEFRLRPDPEHVEGLRGELGPVVVLHPGTSAATPYKRYPAERLGEVARQLGADPGVACVVTAGPDPAERALAARVVAASGGAARLAPETPHFADLAALYAASRLFVGADSGPLHVASMVGTPVVQILGPTHPVENEPYPATPFRQVRIDWPCSPCRRGCAEAPCMSGVEADQVAAAARDLLAKVEASRGARTGTAP
jgi:ADP-heptose:LPS heptosyltransferase